MTNEQLLNAISDMMDNKLKPLQEDVAGLKEDVSVLKEDVAGLKEDVSVLKEDVSVLKEDVSVLKEDVSVLKEDVSVLKEDVTGLKEDVIVLQNGMKRLEILNENAVLPRLQNIEACYTSTYRRYSEGAEQIDTMKMDIDVLKTVVAEHSDKLQRIS